MRNQLNSKQKRETKTIKLTHPSRRISTTMRWFWSSLIIFAAAMIVLTLIYGSKYPEEFSATASGLAVIVAILGVVGVVFQLQRDKGLREAECLINLCNSFLEHDEFVNAYISCNSAIATKLKVPFDIRNIYKCLDFFEPFYYLIVKKIVKIEPFYELFAYRFCIIVNNVEVQRCIDFCAENYCDICGLYCNLKKYAQKRNLIPFDNNGKYLSPDGENHYDLEDFVSRKCKFPNKK